MLPPLSLIQADLDQDTFWKAYGLSRYIFNTEASETPDSQELTNRQELTDDQELETYYQGGEHDGTFSLLPVYFSENFYGLDTIVKVMQGECAYTDVFPEDFEDILEDYREYAGF